MPLTPEELEDEIDAIKAQIVPKTKTTAGHRSSELKVAVAAMIVGAALIGLGTWKARDDLVSQGTSIITWATVGYAGSRAIAKALPKGSK